MDIEQYWVRFCDNFLSPPISKGEFTRRVWEIYYDYIDENYIEGMGSKDILIASRPIEKIINQKF
jgi:hypothetical protein